MVPPNPEQAKGWLAVALSLVERGGPVTLLITLVLGAVTSYGLVQEVKRVHEVNRALWQQLVDAQHAQVELARHCPPPQKER